MIKQVANETTAKKTQTQPLIIPKSSKYIKASKDKQYEGKILRGETDIDPIYYKAEKMMDAHRKELEAEKNAKQ